MQSVAASTVHELVRRAGRRGRAADLVRGRDPPLPAVLVAVDKVGDDARPRAEGLVRGGEAASLSYLLRGTLMSTWGFLPAVFRPFRTVFPGLGPGFLNRAGKTEGTAKKWGKNGEKWARNGLKRVGVS